MAFAANRLATGSTWRAKMLESVTIFCGSGKTEVIACDYLACGFHLVPNVELQSLLGCEISGGYVLVDDFQRTSVPGIFCAGEPTEHPEGLELALVEGQVAGLRGLQQHDGSAKNYSASGAGRGVSRACWTELSVFAGNCATCPRRRRLFAAARTCPIPVCSHTARGERQKLQTRCRNGTVPGNEYAGRRHTVPVPLESGFRTATSCSQARVRESGIWTCGWHSSEPEQSATTGGSCDELEGRDARDHHLLQPRPQHRSCLHGEALAAWLLDQRAARASSPSDRWVKARL